MKRTNTKTTTYTPSSFSHFVKMASRAVFSILSTFLSTLLSTLSPTLSTGLLLTTLLLATSFSAPAASATSIIKNDDKPAERRLPTGKLPAQAEPSSYRLDMRIDPSEETFSGVVEIDVNLLEGNSALFLHGASLTIEEATLVEHKSKSKKETEKNTGRWSQLTDEGLARLDFDRPFKQGPATLRIAYRAPFDRQLKGLYKVVEGERAFAYTQFEATSARYAFPCFDEPRFKTPFSVTLTIPKNLDAISTTYPTKEQVSKVLVNKKAWKTLTFAKTLPLPTYLLAMAVGEFDIVEAKAILPPTGVARDPIPLRGVAVKGKGARLAFALEQAGPLLQLLETYFGLPYPFGKLDLIAVPDFAAGAMENPGAVTFREALLLLDPKIASTGQMRGLIGVTAHELAHMWFGDWVTMPWWDDIWLNEAFATWMGTKISQQWRPDLGFDVGLTERAGFAMENDRLLSARQIRQPIDTHHDIRNAFDGITYSKGAAVLQMFENWMTPRVFQKGIRTYLREHKFANATSEDLLNALSKSAGRDVKTAFTTFLEQAGVPLLTFDVSCREFKVSTRTAQLQLTVTQQRSLPVGSVDPKIDASHPTGAHWILPVCVSLDGKNQCFLLDAPQKQIDISYKNTKCPTSFVGNVEAKGYYQWTVSSEDVPLVQLAYSKTLNKTSEQYDLGRSVLAAWESGLLSTEKTAVLLEPMTEAQHRTVLNIPMTFARTLEKLSSSALRPTARRYGASLVKDVAERIGYTPKPTDDIDRNDLRQNLLDFLAFFADDPRALDELAALGALYLGEKTDTGAQGDGRLHPELVAPSLAGLAVRAAVLQNDKTTGNSKQPPSTWQRTLDHLVNSTDATTRSLLLGALTAARTEASLQRTLALSLDSRMRLNEMLTPIGILGDEMDTQATAFAFVQKNFDALGSRVATTRIGFLPSVFASMCTEADAQTLETFFTPYIESYPGMPRNLRNAVEEIRACSVRKTSQQKDIDGFLAALARGIKETP